MVIFKSGDVNIENDPLVHWLLEKERGKRCDSYFKQWFVRNTNLRHHCYLLLSPIEVIRLRSVPSVYRCPIAAEDAKLRTGKLAISIKSATSCRHRKERTSKSASSLHPETQVRSWSLGEGVWTVRRQEEDDRQLGIRPGLRKTWFTSGKQQWKGICETWLRWKQPWFHWMFQ